PAGPHDRVAPGGDGTRGSGIGPLVGSEITLLYGRHAVLWCTSVLTGLAGLVLLRYARETQPRTRTAGVSFAVEFTRSCRALLGNRVFAALLLLILLLRLGQNMLEPFVALFVHELGPPMWMVEICSSESVALERTIGLAFSVLAVAQVVFTPWWGRASDRLGPLRCLSWLALVLGVTQIATASVEGIGGFLSLRSLSACFMAGSMTLAYAAVSRRVQQERRTFAFSLVQSCMQFGFALGPWMGSHLASIGATREHANLRLPFVVAGVLCVTAGLGMLVLRRVSAGRLAPGPGVPPVEGL
ncbi:MAG: MFS transporter, partial [Planctomycetota bacterium]